MKQPLTLLCSLLCTLLYACGGSGGGTEPPIARPNTPTPIPTPTPPAAETIDGSVVYMEPQANGNTFACAHCHALSEPSDSFTRPGHPIGDALRRPSFKNGQLDNFIDAVNICLNEWMGLSTPWTSSAPEFIALSEFLASRDTGSGDAETLEFAVAAPLSFDSIEQVNGNSAIGQTTFNASCAICHGENAVGTERAPALAGLLSDANYIASRVRTGGNSDSQVYPGLSGGRMPFWAEDRLSNQELRDVISYLIASESDPGDNQSPGGGDLNRECSSTHPSIGQTATLNGLFHQVAGTATIIDDCTIELSNFTYDAQGIDVRVYGALNRNYNSSGFSMGSNLVRDRAYDRETLRVQLPEGKTLDDINSLSIWCIPARVNFGDAVFQ